MRKFIKMPSGVILAVSDKVADILATRPGHVVVRAPATADQQALADMRFRKEIRETVHQLDTEASV
jgi:hypothetical protein